MGDGTLTNVREPTPADHDLGTATTSPALGHASASVSSTLQRGAVFDRYLVIGRLGAGGMGVVYAAYDPELDRKVAIKLLHDEGESEDAWVGRARLLREARALARLAHPNVVAVYDANAVNDDVFIVMELVEGQTLREWLEVAPRTWRETLALYAQSGRGLAAAHAGGLVHRDFKPDNVLVGKDGRARVLDFGLARATGARESKAMALVDPTRGLCR